MLFWENNYFLRERVSQETKCADERKTWVYICPVPVARTYDKVFSWKFILLKFKYKKEQ